MLSYLLHMKEPLLLIGKSGNVVAAAGFLSIYLNGLIPYVRMNE